MKKPSGWKDGPAKSTFWHKDSAYGAKYKCRFCGKETLGMYFGSDRVQMHSRECSKRIPALKLLEEK